MNVQHFVLIASAVICCLIYRGNASPTDIHKEHLAELYYRNQLKERVMPNVPNNHSLITANYPCLYGITPIGLDTAASVIDGHKFTCGLHHVKSRPIVYSFGSNQQQDFEKSILFYRPDALVYTFEIQPDQLPRERDPQIVYTILGLGPTDNSKPIKMLLLHEIMKSLNHTYVDVLKIDIEGGEHAWVQAEPLDTWTRVGQLLLEVHNFQFSGKLSMRISWQRVIILCLLLSHCFQFSPLLL